MPKVQVSQVGAAWEAIPPTTRPERQGGNWSTGRGFVIPQAAAEPEPAKMPSPEEIDAALSAAETSIKENGATPAQTEAMQELTRIVMASDNPPAAAGRVVELIEEVKAAKGCNLLDGQCVRHIDDHGETIHRGPEHKATAGGDDNLLTHSLIQWGDTAAPRLEFFGGGTWPDLDLPDVDALIAATEKQLASLRDSRAHLAAALARDVPEVPPEETVEDIAASLGAAVIEVDPANKPDSLKDIKVHGWGAFVHGRMTFVFPAGQDPAERLAAARKIADQLKASE